VPLEKDREREEYQLGRLEAQLRLTPSSAGHSSD
jgi:hypothetical protein